MDYRAEAVKDWDLYFITDSRLSRNGIFSDVGEALDAGAKIVQYREKGRPTNEMYAEAFKLRKMCAGRAEFIVDDRLDIALAVSADGIHVGQDDLSVEIIRRVMPSAIIGYTVHTVQQAIEAEKLGADYLSLGHIFHTTTKHHDTQPIGLEVVRQVRKVVSRHLVAIGGIKRFNVASVIEAGADSAAMISGIVSTNDVYGEVKKVREIIRSCKEKELVAHGHTDASR